MAKNLVLRLGWMIDDCTKQRAFKAAADVCGIDLISADLKEQKLTVTGKMDPVAVAQKLRKYGSVDIVSAGPAPEKKQEK